MTRLHNFQFAFFNFQCPVSNSFVGLESSFLAQAFTPGIAAERVQPHSWGDLIFEKWLKPDFKTS